MTNPKPIGIFDSGVGGLSVLKEIRNLSSAEDLIYYADSAHCPYGFRSTEEIRSRIIQITRFLLENNAKMIVAACNTASIAGLDFLRRMFNIPIVGMEPAIKPAVTLTKNGKVGVLATGVTISGEKFNSLLDRYANGIEVFKVACPGLVEQVEQGLINEPRTKAMLKVFLKPLIEAGVDTIVLGCTHYPFLRHQVEAIVGPSVQVIDTGNAVARRVVQVLSEEGLLSDVSSKKGQEQFYTSGEPEYVEKVINNLWGKNSIEVKKIAL
ncbi:glutamate racemase [Desulfotomaculum arcticum]|uniref:Glutamate racemase n=1 Tax=Desulfotruncus arcticus DSM 17038 TaxID=1121424 RepID=A0A1I2ZJW1_9FIRM|nr:glutamate racemase [Desulfotruncus arcticus]SFH38103.1 glutamate racemase [Desulfotomaculum arcticum] [Desulfotruncus arcticus DSM 17038]